MTDRLRDKVAIVTGGASGIGHATVQAFLAQGAKVVVADLSRDLEAVIGTLGASAAGIRTDVSDPGQAAAMIEFAIERFGRLDVLCNNAGIDGAQKPLVDYDPAEFDRVLAVNLRGVFLGIKYATPHLAERGGAIINVASIAGSVVMPQMAAYCASKAGVMQLTKVAAVENARSNVRVNCIAPGVIRTQMVADLPPEFIAGLEAATPVGRIADPAEVANLAVFLASDESPFLTGMTINIDGGFTLL
ncbi:SDR family oxidoreductase [Sphingomonas sp. CL5.1]|uniref:SDR family NAD(P)-dependent oxidoreductase n=1 Tax=Sphingomonas sp. CL5.1 TaxID=2653203 RepID=UPI0015823682|nr:SDR family NAD(P)-dependent oxidoreductase [Sphingomonas sp. CL5.1]QKR98348.1 SDR family oxidoreductase [Sphingomonas sp. CL5.1]